ncbi:MAG: hypothetical protein GX814_07025 [Microbacteriaceae bacterium]|nr:hypothetical protein [Microbacteriaceae bacterium]
MNDRHPRSSATRRILIGVLIAALLLLAAAVAMMWPMLTHQSAGGSGHEVPEGFVAATSATGADGRTRILEVFAEDGDPAELADLREGEILVVRGSGYDPEIGIYVSICMIPSLPEEKPGPCLGGLPEGAMEGDAAGENTPLTSSWITDAWAWRAFATKGYDDPEAGSFEVRLLVPPPAQDGLHCEHVLCAITTRADHTAGSDRVQDLQLPVAFG